MSLPELENLARIGKLKREPPTDHEIEGLLGSAQERLTDAKRADLSTPADSTLPTTPHMPSRSRLCGDLETDERLLAELIAVAMELQELMTSASKGASA